jgi:hypothetical protein
MKAGIQLFVFSMALGASFGSTASAEDRADDQVPPSTMMLTNDGKIVVDGTVFETWEDYWKSDLYKGRGRRCGTVVGPAVPPPVRDAADCEADFTDPTSEYAPYRMRYRIPVVVHVIRADDGSTGHIPQALVHSQINVMNEDYRALFGTNGAPGTDAEVEFYLAHWDPDGNATDGITYSSNTEWFEDNGEYWETLAWDPHHYLNIYTNLASDHLGYANIPQAPANPVGSNADRVVIAWDAFGRPGLRGPPYDLGRTATHEVGHYLGLYHTFQGGCGEWSTPGCYSTGDCICDTDPDETETGGCPGGDTSCDRWPIPIENYMEYTDDACMSEFTSQQARRLRCTLEYWRPDLAEEITTWADFDHFGVQVGTLDLPYSTLAKALDDTVWNGVIKIKSSSSGETLTINQSIRLEAHGGNVTIGVPGACSGHCTSNAPEGCGCDDACIARGDCCPGTCTDCPDLLFCGP